jgi:hypothetical protein
MFVVYALITAVKVPGQPKGTVQGIAMKSPTTFAPKS